MEGEATLLQMRRMTKQEMIERAGGRRIETRTEEFTIEYAVYIVWCWTTIWIRHSVLSMSCQLEFEPCSAHLYTPTLAGAVWRWSCFFSH